MQIYYAFARFENLTPSLVKDGQNTVTYKSRLTQKKWHKKPMLFLASMGEMGLSHDIFFDFHLGLMRWLRSNDDRC